MTFRTAVSSPGAIAPAPVASRSGQNQALCDVAEGEQSRRVSTAPATARDVSSVGALAYENGFLSALKVWLAHASPDEMKLLLQHVVLTTRSRGIDAEHQRRVTDAAAYETASDAIESSFPYLELAAVPTRKLRAVIEHPEPLHPAHGRSPERVRFASPYDFGAPEGGSGPVGVPS